MSKAATAGVWPAAAMLCNITAYRHETVARSKRTGGHSTPCGRRER